MFSANNFTRQNLERQILPENFNKVVAFKTKDLKLSKITSGDDLPKIDVKISLKLKKMNSN